MVPKKSFNFFWFYGEMFSSNLPKWVSFNLATHFPNQMFFVLVNEQSVRSKVSFLQGRGPDVVGWWVGQDPALRNRSTVRVFDRNQELIPLSPVRGNATWTHSLSFVTFTHRVIFRGYLWFENRPYLNKSRKGAFGLCVVIMERLKRVIRW